MAEMSEQDRAWEEHKGKTKWIPPEWTDEHRACFNAGMNAGIFFAMRQVGYDLIDHSECPGHQTGDRQ